MEDKQDSGALEDSIQILTAHEGNGGKLLSPEVKFNLGLLFTEACRAEVNSRSRLNLLRVQ